MASHAAADGVLHALAGGARTLRALQPFSQAYVEVSGAELHVITQVETALHSTETRDQQEALRQLRGLLSSGSVRVEAVPNTIAERLGELITVSELHSSDAQEIEPSLDDMLDAAFLLSTYENHLEVWESMDLSRCLSRLANSETLSADAGEKIGSIKSRLAELKSRERNRTYSFIDDASPEESIRIDIRQLRYTQVGLAWKVWDSGLLLSSFIFRNRALFREKHVLELGSGCGLAGLILAHYADTVIMTDYIDEALENIQHNLKAYQQHDRRLDHDTVTIHRLDWTDPSTYPSVPEEGMDMIIGSDVVYDLTAAASVPKVVRSLLHRRHGVAIFVLPAMRMGVMQFEEKMAEEGMTGHKWVIPNRGNDDALNFYVYWPDPEGGPPRKSELVLHRESEL